ncbi:MAG TPA: hypothetical protein PKK15_06980 [Kouleothrix sp.]|nr:hypothetical protein [Kouleothrix sp.]
MSSPLADLKAVYARLKRMPPFVVRFWYVDRPAEYSATYRLWPMRFHDAWQAAAWPQLLEWRTAIATPEEQARAPWWCALPGIWIEYNDGMVMFAATLNPRQETYGITTHRNHLQPGAPAPRTAVHDHDDHD